MAPHSKIETTQVRGTDLKPSHIARGTWAIGGWMWGGSDDAQSIPPSNPPSIAASR